MADMAEISQVEAAGRRWSAGTASEIVPLTYINSTPHQGFLRRAGGMVCTCPARARLEWAFQRGTRICFLPDQHLGRNTGFTMGIPLEEMAFGSVGLQAADKESWRPSVILWKPLRVHYASASRVDAVRAKYLASSDVIPSAARVCQKAAAQGSTEG